MERASYERARALRAREPEPALRKRALATPPPPGLELSREGFDLIAEVKRRAPSAGALAVAASRDEVVERARAYARAGACAVSVLTEPARFDGSLADLSAVAQGVPVPAMRKDFLVDPLQVFEARAAGAGGVLLIARMLSDARLGELLDAAREAACFVLLEAFGGDDLARLCELALPEETLIGLNARDLVTLDQDPSRFERLAAAFPGGFPRVAESGLEDAEQVARAARAGYRLALVGSALMRAREPEGLARRLLTAGRREAAGRSS
jgi:indole-3-glycerol phosphate synthase